MQILLLLASALKLLSGDYRDSNAERGLSSRCQKALCSGMNVYRVLGDESSEQDNYLVGLN